MKNTTPNRREANDGFETILSHCPELAGAISSKSLEWRINYRATRLCRKFCLSAEDHQDISQEFRMTLFRASRKYNPDKCPPERFVRMVLNRNYKHWVRKLDRADKKRAISVDAMHFDDVAPDLEYYILDPKSRNDLRLADFGEDVRSVIGTMPDKLRDICLELMSDSPFEIARQRGVHHSAIYRAIPRIREYFVRAGIDKFSQIDCE